MRFVAAVGAAVCAVLIASIVCSPFAMYAQGDTPITAASAQQVATDSLLLGVLVVVFLGLIAGLLAGLAALLSWVIDR